MFCLTTRTPTAPPIGSMSEDIGVVQLSSPSVNLAICMGTLTKSEGEGIMAEEEGLSGAPPFEFLIQFLLKTANNEC